MNFLEEVQDNAILIIPNSLKNKVLDYIDDNALLKNIKLMTFFDLKKGLMFDYDNKTIYEAMKQFKLSYGVAKDYLNNLYYINEENDSKKINYLSEIKKYLDDNELLIKDSLFKQLLKSKRKLYVYGFDYISKFNNYLLKMCEDVIDVVFLEKTSNAYSHDVLEFKTMFEEVAFVFERISELLDKGIEPAKIHITNYSDEYYFIFNILRKQFNLPIYLKNNTSLYDTVIGKFFLDNLESNKERLLYKIKKKFDYANNKTNQNCINKLTNLLNTYYWCDDVTSIKDIILEDLKKCKINPLHFKEEIETTTILDNTFDDSDYVFLIGFNLGSVPKLKRDEDYLNDAIKPSYLETSSEYNKEIKARYLKAIASIKNLTITYKLNSPFANYSRSFLCADARLTVKKMTGFVSNYANSYNKLLLGKGIDNLIQFNEKDEYLELLFNNYDIAYKTYDNKFSGLEVEKLRNDLNENIVFSYSNIANYYKCPFKFYVSSILKINEYATTLEQFIGNTYHYVLERCLEEDIDVEKVYDEYINEHKGELSYTYKEQFFIETLKKEMCFVVETIKEQYKHSSHTDSWYEKEIVVDIERKIKTKLKGFVDKILVFNKDLLIVDYKTTNSQAINAEVFEFGLSIQLPIYLYLLKCIDSNYKVAGIYIQHILDLNNEYVKDKDPLLEKKKKLKLEGITFDDCNSIANFDDTYEKSEIIKSLSTKDGAIKKNKSILALEERDELISMIEKLIFKAIDDVSEALFPISPIKIEKVADGCKYCQYKDICFRKFKDFNLQTIKSKGGEEDE